MSGLNMQGSFWTAFGMRFGGTSGSGGIDELLERTDITVEQILDHDDVIQECKYLNAQLIEYLSNKDITRKLIEYVIESPGNTSNNHAVIESIHNHSTTIHNNSNNETNTSYNQTNTTTDDTTPTSSDTADDSVIPHTSTNESFDKSVNDTTTYSNHTESTVPTETHTSIDRTEHEMDIIAEPTSIDDFLLPTLSTQSNALDHNNNTTNNDDDDTAITATATSSTQIHRYPYVASELFACEVVSMLDVLFNDISLIDLLFTFLDRPAPIDPSSASYFRKVVVVLIQRKHDELVNYIATHNIIDKLVCHIGLYSVMELLIMIGWDDGLGQIQCLASDTRVMMYDLRANGKAVQDIRIGDKLMGSDQQPRIVTWCCNNYINKNTAPMYRIIPASNNGINSQSSFDVTYNHVLVMQFDQLPYAEPVYNSHIALPYQCNGHTKSYHPFQYYTIQHFVLTDISNDYNDELHAIGIHNRMPVAHTIPNHTNVRRWYGTTNNTVDEIPSNENKQQNGTRMKLAEQQCMEYIQQQLIDGDGMPAVDKYSAISRYEPLRWYTTAGAWYDSVITKASITNNSADNDAGRAMLGTTMYKPQFIRYNGNELYYRQYNCLPSPLISDSYTNTIQHILMQHNIKLTFNSNSSSPQLIFISWLLGVWLSSGRCINHTTVVLGESSHISNMGSYQPIINYINHNVNDANIFGSSVTATSTVLNRCNVPKCTDCECNDVCYSECDHSNRLGHAVYRITLLSPAQSDHSTSLMYDILSELNMHQKKCIPHTLMDTYSDYCRSFMSGVIDGGGYYSRYHNYIFNINPVVNVDEQVLNGVRDIAYTLGMWDTDESTHDRLVLSGNLHQLNQYIVLQYKHHVQPSDDTCYNKHVWRFTIETIHDDSTIIDQIWYGFTVNGANREFCLLDGTITHNSTDWLYQQQLVPKLVDKLHPQYESLPDVHMNAARALVDVVVKCPPSNASTLVAHLQSPDILHDIFTHMFSGSLSSLTNAMSIIIVLIQRYANCKAELLDIQQQQHEYQQSQLHNTSSDELSPPHDTIQLMSDDILEEPFISLQPYLPRLLALLADDNTTLHNTEVQTQFGRAVPFGETRMKVVELCLVLFRSHVTPIDVILIEYNVLSILLDAFFYYTWNNMLHGLVESIIRTVLDSTSYQLKKSLFNDAKLVQKFIHAFDHNTNICNNIGNDTMNTESYQSQRSSDRYRQGYMGHLIRTSTAIDELCKSDETNELMNELIGDDINIWNDYVINKLSTEYERQKIGVSYHTGDDEQLLDGLQFDITTHTDQYMSDHITTTHDIQLSADDLNDDSAFDAAFNSTDNQLLHINNTYTYNNNHSWNNTEPTDLQTHSDWADFDDIGNTDDNTSSIDSSSTHEPKSIELDDYTRDIVSSSNINNNISARQLLQFEIENEYDDDDNTEEVIITDDMNNTNETPMKLPSELYQLSLNNHSTQNNPEQSNQSSDCNNTS